MLLRNVGNTAESHEETTSKQDHLEQCITMKAENLLFYERISFRIHLNMW